MSKYMADIYSFPTKYITKRITGDYCPRCGAYIYKTPQIFKVANRFAIKFEPVGIKEIYEDYLRGLDLVVYACRICGEVFSKLEKA